MVNEVESVPARLCRWRSIAEQVIAKRLRNEME